MNGDELGNRFSVFRDNDTIGIYSIEQREALLLKFGSRYSFHKTIIQPRLNF